MATLLPCYRAVLQLALGTRYLARPAPRFYSRVSNLVLVGEDFFCKFLLDLIKPRVPCTAELFADHSVLVELIGERSGLEGSLRPRLPLLLLHCLLLHYCCCNAGPLAAVVPTGPGPPKQFLHSDAAVHCSGSARLRNDSYSNIPSENAQTSTQHWRSDDPVLIGPKTHRGNVYPPLVSSTCGRRGLLLTNSLNLQSSIQYSICNPRIAQPSLKAEDGPASRRAYRQYCVQAHRAPHCRHVLSRARCVVHLYPPSFNPSVQYAHANKVVTSKPSLPLRSGVVYLYGCVPPPSNSTRAAAPLICKQCLTTRPNPETLSFVHRSPDGQIAQGFAEHYSTQRQRLSPVSQAPRSRRHGRISWATNSPSRHACLSRPRIGKDPRTSPTI